MWTCVQQNQINARGFFAESAARASIACSGQEQESNGSFVTSEDWAMLFAWADRRKSRESGPQPKTAELSFPSRSLKIPQSFRLK